MKTRSKHIAHYLSVIFIIILTITIIITSFLISDSQFFRNSKAAVTQYGYSTQGGVVFHNAQPIMLHGANWFGFENNGTNLVHGLWARGYKDMIQQMKGIGINALRIPYCPSTLKNVTIAQNSYVDPSKNPDLINASGTDIGSLDALDKILTELNNQQMYFILDDHNPDCIAQSDLWYTSQYTENQWIADLSTIALRYKSMDYFVGLDLKNEPRNVATWGTGNMSTDWNLAAERAGSQLLTLNPNILMIIEGVSENPVCSNSGYGHFWGENLEPFACTPINTTSIPQNKLILSPHIYGPDVYNQSYFSDSSFPQNMPNIWDKQFGYLISQGYTLIPTEWGGKYGNGGLPTDVTWHNALTAYFIKNHVCNSFYWSWNPDSGDTGGILQDDWTNVWSNKVSMLQNYFNNCQNNNVNPGINPVSTTIPVLPTLLPPVINPNSFTGSYFNNQSLSETPAIIRNDSDINFDWGTGSPDNSIPSDHFSARWTKTQNFNGGNYAFNMTVDDGGRLYIDNNLILDKWFDQAATTYSTNVTLSQGMHSIKFEFYDDQGFAVAKLNFNQTNIPSATSTPIPTLSPTVTPTAVPTNIPPVVSQNVCNVQITEFEWNNGFNTNMVINNKSNSDLNGWSLNWNFPYSDQFMNQIWNATANLNSQSVTVNNESWDNVIPAQGFVQFGFNGQLSIQRSAKPTNITLSSGGKTYSCSIN